jgi:hypothetical protein
MQDQIEQLKGQYTDKYVVVDVSRPELARFRDVVGRVKTVNMSGRALVEFDDYHLNVGWYDIDLDFLKVVDKPPPKAAKTETKKAPAKPAAKAEKPAAKPQAAAPAAKAGRGSVADILAAARAGKSAAPVTGKAVAAAPAAKPQAAAPAATGAPAKVDRSKMSVADMLAAARAGGAGGATAKATPAAAPAKQIEPEEEPAAEAKPQATAAPSAKPEAGPGEIERVDKSGMSIDQMVAYCRAHDGK